MFFRVPRGTGGGREVVQIPLEKIRFGGFQPRYAVRAEDLAGLVASIKEVGVLQPVLVRPAGEFYELVAGERRVRASSLAGLKSVPALVCSLTDLEAAEVALAENLQRQSLHFLEEAEGLARLVERFGLTQSEVARRVGLSQSAVANKLRLLRLPSAVRRRIYELGLTERHARALLCLKREEDQLELLALAAERPVGVREWERLVQQKMAGAAPISREIERCSRRRLRPLVKDLRLFINSLEQGVRVLREAGFEVRLHHQQADNVLRVVIEVERC